MNKILCVDDDPTTIMLYKSVIQRSRVVKDVVTALSGVEAINYYASILDSTKEGNDNYPDLIFLDLNMPVMSGWEFLDEFMKSYYSFFPKTKVIILTSSIDPKDKEKACNYTIAIGFRSKPLTVRMLTEIQI